MTHVTCRLTAKNRDQLQNPTLGNRVWATFTLFPSLFVQVKGRTGRRHSSQVGIEARTARLPDIEFASEKEKRLSYQLVFQTLKCNYQPAANLHTRAPLRIIIELYGTKVRRYNWHSPGWAGWPFPVLKY